MKNNKTENLILPHGQSAPLKHGWDWLTSGREDIKKSCINWLIFSAVFSLITLVLSLLYVIPLLGTGIRLLMPVLIGGLMYACHKLHTEGVVKISFIFAAFEQKKLVDFVILGAVGLLIDFSFSIAYSSLILPYSGIEISFVDFQLNINLDNINFGFIVASAIFLMIYILAVLSYVTAMLFAPALVVLNDVKPLEALKMGFFAGLKNTASGTLYSLLCLGLFLVVFCVIASPILFFEIYTGKTITLYPYIAETTPYLLEIISGTLLLFVSLIASLPLFAPSLYAAYRDIFLKKDA